MVRPMAAWAMMSGVSVMVAVSISSGVLVWAGVVGVGMRTKVYGAWTKVALKMARAAEVRVMSLVAMSAVSTVVVVDGMAVLTSVMVGGAMGMTAQKMEDKMTAEAPVVVVVMVMRVAVEAARAIVMEPVVLEAEAEPVTKLEAMAMVMRLTARVA